MTTNKDQLKNKDNQIQLDQFSTSAKKEKSFLLKRIVQIYAMFFLVLLGFIAGLITSGFTRGQTDANVLEATATEIIEIFSDIDGVDPALFEEAWEVLHTYYFKRNQISETDLFYGAVAGMVAAIDDDYTLFLDPELATDFTQELNGSFFGIGAEIGRKQGYLVIIAPLPDSPAEIAGLRAGDKVLAIDGLDASGMSTDLAVSLIRGRKGEAVVLTILSKEESVPRELSVNRDEVKIPSVVYTLEDDISIIEITHFNSDTDSRFTKIAQQVLRDNPRGIILDLRNNPGGYLDVAVDLAGSWLEPNQVVVREIFGDQRDSQDYKANKTVDLSSFLTVILVNEGSASASEILAGALQDYEAAKLVGQTTFGKGSVQQLFDLNDGSAIKMTVANWLTPKGRTIEEAGIEPDFLVEYTIEDYNNDLDPQLDKARELINQ